MSVIHGSCVAIGERAVLLRGGSGSGKSDLALRLIDEGATLVADDYVALSAQAGRLYAEPPAALSGLIEVRGLGLVQMPYRQRAPVELNVTLVTRQDMARLPEPQSIELGGIALPAIHFVPFEASATAKIRLALRALCEDGDDGYVLSAT